MMEMKKHDTTTNSLIYYQSFSALSGKEIAYKTARTTVVELFFKA